RRKVVDDPPVEHVPGAKLEALFAGCSPEIGRSVADPADRGGGDDAVVVAGEYELRAAPWRQAVDEVRQGGDARSIGKRLAGDHPAVDRHELGERRFPLFPADRKTVRLGLAQIVAPPLVEAGALLVGV